MRATGTLLIVALAATATARIFGGEHDEPDKYRDEYEHGRHARDAPEHDCAHSTRASHYDGQGEMKNRCLAYGHHIARSMPREAEKSGHEWDWKHEFPGMPKASHVVRAIKDAYDWTSDKAGEAAEFAKHKADTRGHWARGEPHGKHPDLEHYGDDEGRHWARSEHHPNGDVYRKMEHSEIYGHAQDHWARSEHQEFGGHPGQEYMGPAHGSGHWERDASNRDSFDMSDKEHFKNYGGDEQHGSSFARSVEMPSHEGYEHSMPDYKHEPHGPVHFARALREGLFPTEEHKKDHSGFAVANFARGAEDGEAEEYADALHRRTNTLTDFEDWADFKDDMSSRTVHPPSAIPSHSRAWPTATKTPKPTTTGRKAFFNW